MVLLLNFFRLRYSWTLCVLFSLTPRCRGNPPHSRSASTNCRCVPDQWEGILESVERDFDMNEGRMDEMESRVLVHYDYTNEKFAMTELDNGKTVIEDYSRRLKYIITEQGCYVMPTEETMKRMCLPDESEHLGIYQLATDVPVSLYQLSSSASNMSLKTAVREGSCLPVYEDLVMSARGFASVTNSLYLNTRSHIRDESVFHTPSNCVPADDGTMTGENDVQGETVVLPNVATTKRGGSSFSSSILNRLKV